VHDGVVHIYAVTNDHVTHKYPVISFPGIEPLGGTDRDWIPHPDGDDLAVRPLGLFRAQSGVYVDRKLFLTLESMRANRIGPGDDCFMLGRYIAPGGEQRTQTVVRFGNLSTWPEPIRQKERGFEQESFLVDMRSLSGFSGSPVFVYFPVTGFLSDPKTPEEREAEEDQPKSFANLTPLPKTGWRHLIEEIWLLGVDWGHVPLTQEVLDAFGEPVKEGWRLSVNTGMAAVVPAWKLDALLDVEELVMARQKADAAHTEKPGADMDLAAPLESTASLLGKLMKVPKEEADEVHRSHQE